MNKKRLTKAEQRVQIAKDVIKWLRLGKLKAKKGHYVVGVSEQTVGDGIGQFEGDANVLTRLQQRNVPCEVCARGALFIAAVDRYDECRISKAAGDYRVDSALANLAGWEAEDERGLSRFFAKKQYLLIEYAFEGAVYGEAADDERLPDVKLAKRWKVAYRGASARLDAICRNIVSNNGTFVLESIPWPRKQK